ncbi:alpha/beta hydrolase [Shewanella putrefaciens]|jgi:predicted alpha/beta superfamily hydrolase|uniref:alpha/beta hydrolase n=2 Tax=Shewanella putrefaciens TaxID=24 RepID=UPI00286BA615|nr:alpha/beta hydrolase-fold protein [Shewanella putrefaciens]
MMFFKFIKLAFAIVVFFSMPLSAKESTEFKIRNTHTLQIKSEVSGLEYELYIRLPNDYSENNKKYPLVLLNDTGYSVAVASGIVHLMAGRDIEDVIIVGISYSKGHNPLLSRTRDYTPTYAPNEKRGHSLEVQKYSGKASQYISFISDEVLPLISQTYRIRQDKKIFVGHSYGGLLGAHILMTNPELFDDYILGSPSFWYDNKVMFRMESDYAKSNKSLKANVFMYIGSEEGSMVEQMLAFENQLKSRNYQGLSIQSKVLPGLTHHSAFAVLLTDGLQKAIPRKSKGS